METFKAVVAALLSPLVIALLLQLAGWYVRGRRRRLGTGLVFAGTVVLLLGSMSGWTYESRRAAEYQYSPLPLDQLPAGKLAIVVLGTGFNPDPLLPANSQVGGAFLSRLLEGVRLWRARPDALLVVSIAGTAEEGDKRRFWQQMQLLLGLAAGEVALLTAAESTLDEAFLVRDVVRGRSVVLATSAGHMPRAMRIFADEGLSVTAAPTDFGMPRRGGPKDWRWPRWVPSADGVGSNHAWLYEAVAGIWQVVRQLVH